MFSFKGFGYIKSLVETQLIFSFKGFGYIKSLVETQLIFSFKVCGYMFQIQSINQSIIRPSHQTNSRYNVRTCEHMVLALCSFVGSHIFYC